MIEKEYFIYLTFKDENGKIYETRQIGIDDNDFLPTGFPDIETTREYFLIVDEKQAWHQLDDQGMIWQRQVPFNLGHTATAKIS